MAPVPACPSNTVFLGQSFQPRAKRRFLVQLSSWTDLDCLDSLDWTPRECRGALSNQSKPIQACPIGKLDKEGIDIYIIIIYLPLPSRSSPAKSAGMTYITTSSATCAASSITRGSYTATASVFFTRVILDSCRHSGWV